MRYTAKAPLAVDFGGTFTDLPAFVESSPEGGAVLAAAFATYVTGSIERDNGASLGDWHAILAGSRSRVSYELEAPLAAGLGTSATQSLLWMTMVKATIANVDERAELAERAWRLDQEMGLFSGKARHHAVAAGGFTMTRVTREGTEVQDTRPGFPFTDELEAQLVVAHAGQGIPSSAINAKLEEQLKDGNTDLVRKLELARSLAEDTCRALLGHNLPEVGRLMNATWENQRKLDPRLSDERLDRLAAGAVKAGAIGVKPAGVGSGGCLVSLSGEGAAGAVREALQKAGATLVPFAFDWYGVHLAKDG